MFFGSQNKYEDLQFFYHPDHLGSSNYITDASGEVYQHNEYFPYGETFVEERNNTEYTTYLFSGKELDVETGLYYFHARYYDPVRRRLHRRRSITIGCAYKNYENEKQKR